MQKSFEETVAHDLKKHKSVPLNETAGISNANP